MTFEKRWDEPTEQQLQDAERPHDTLNTPEKANVDKRGRLFSEQGGFQNLLRLKIALRDLQERCTEMKLFGSGQDYFFLRDITANPENFADSVLSPNRFDEPEIKTADLDKRLEYYIKKEKKDLLTEIRVLSEIIIKYSVIADSESLKYLKNSLEWIGKYINDDEWENYGRLCYEIKGYVRGLYDLTGICCGDNTESTETIKSVGANWADRKK